MTDNTADITGIGWITSAGHWRGQDIRTAAVRDAMGKAMTGGKLPDIPLDGSYPHSRRMDTYSRLGMSAVSLALEDAGLSVWTDKRNIGIMASTEYGCLNTDFDYFDTVLPDGGIGASPGLFSYTLHSSFMGDVSIRFGLTGPAFVINECPAFSLTGVRLALNAVVCADAEKMLCGFCNPERPHALKDSRQVPAGAIFLVIEKMTAHGFSYGNLEQGRTGSITFNGETVNTLDDLVRQCLADR